MTPPKKSQEMKASTAAAKLDVYLPATPAEFQASSVSREELTELQRNPPQWLVDLRRDGPHPRSVIAGRLRISIAGLARGGVTDPLSTAEIEALQADPPSWLVREREIAAEVRREERRQESREADRRAAAAAAAAPEKPKR
ncbi:DUF5997 family protein [Cellulomonas sp. URHD0024]|uniref:DUF5997 family protein n=1 Tax=Cellulomonas sp. URHD0024 TaxID=1302620 RepID=UPI0004191A46|nr:DUF5997 family protein [Cellulomonas sp. URHD0024]